MQIHVPDPAYTSSARSRDNFRLAVKLALAFVALLWLIQIPELGTGRRARRFRRSPAAGRMVSRDSLGAAHARRFRSSLANSLPLADPRHDDAVPVSALGAAGIAGGLFRARHRGVAVRARIEPHRRQRIGLRPRHIYLRRGSYSGATGARSRPSLLVCFLYGALVWGVLPIAPRLSWETHLAAAVIGFALGIALRNLDIPPRVRYSWEIERDELDEEESIDVAARE